MTRKRNDTHSTEFGLWLREQQRLDSSLGFLATNLDYVWKNYKTGLWLMIEEKRHKQKPRQWQLEMFRLLDSAAQSDSLYRGFYILRFENSNPEDGRMVLTRLDGTPREITKEQLIAFLAFGES
jgi:hypothetical protein